MTPADERAIQDAAERRRQHASGRAYALECGCEDCLAARRADVPKTVSSDSQERWRWFGKLIARVLRGLGQ